MYPAELGVQLCFPHPVPLNAFAPESHSRHSLFLHILVSMWGFQMLVCTVDGDLYPPLEEQTVATDPKANKKKDKDREKKFIWNHGSE